MFINKLTPKQKKELEGLTVEEALMRWQKLYAIGRKPRTVEYHHDLIAVIRRHWPDMQTVVANVTDAQCVAFAERIAHFSTTRYNGMLNTMRVVIPEMACVPRRHYVAPERHLPTPEQYDRLLCALDVAQAGHAGLVVRFLAHTGLRINEARQLRWEHVRDDHIYAPADVTKNGKPRCIPFIAGMADVLKALRRARPWTARRNGFILPQAECGKTLRFACRLAGIPHVTHHTFRHFYATQCIRSGVDIPTVAKWLGHSDGGALLLRTYCHLIDDHTLEMAKKVKVGGLAVPESKQTANIVPLPVGIFGAFAGAPRMVAADAVEPAPIVVENLPVLENKAA